MAAFLFTPHLFMAYRPMQTIKNLQTLRAVGAAMIFAHHFGFKNHIVDSFGDCGVCWFMMLSGFIGYGVWSSRPHDGDRSSLIAETAGYIKKRVSKIAPFYYVGLLVALILAKFTYSALSVSTAILMIQSWIPERDVFFGPNAPAWFVSSLMFCLVLFPLLRRLPESTLFKILSLTIIVYLCVLLFIPEHRQLYWIYIFPPMQFPSFLIGMVIWPLATKCKSKIHSAISANAINVIAWGFTILLILNHHSIPYAFRLSSYWWIGTGLLIIGLTVTDKIRCVFTKVMHLTIFQKLGDASMSFYLLHLPWIYSFRIILRHLVEYRIINELTLTAEF
ncbi:MAG: acyltransferase, partial [Duncaniella sp.]|nr:acyltransferase [Duncaniella sp.]